MLNGILPGVWILMLAGVIQGLTGSPSMPPLVGDPPPGGENSASPVAPTSWFLLELAGNNSVIFARYSDFLLYLQMNIASVTLTDFEKVRLNSLSYSPTLLLNISLGQSSDLAILRSLAADNDSILEFSGEVFKIISITAKDEILLPRMHELFPSLLKDNLVLLLVGLVLLLLACLGVCASTVFCFTSRKQGGSQDTEDKQPIFYSRMEGSDDTEDKQPIFYSRTEGSEDTEDRKPIFYSRVEGSEDDRLQDHLEISRDSLKSYQEDFDILSENASDRPESSLIWKSSSTSSASPNDLWKSSLTSSTSPHTSISTSVTPQPNLQTSGPLDPIPSPGASAVTPQSRPSTRRPRPPAPLRSDSLAPSHPQRTNSQLTQLRKCRPMSVPAPCHLSVGWIEEGGAHSNSAHRSSAHFNSTHPSSAHSSSTNDIVCVNISQDDIDVDISYILSTLDMEH